MSAQPAALDTMPWTKGMSTKRVSFEYRSTRVEAATNEKANAEDPASKTHPMAHVQWKVGDYPWKKTSPQVQALGISGYQFSANATGVAELEFTNTQGRHFAFVGQDQEVFNVYVTSEGDHTVRIGKSDTVITGVMIDWE
ncbi:hypothetical protein B0H17DRAFT_1063311 [Mycena rosella]|uniref:Uncharacterized protein n=1 Tax=Mycena rosella TaxID=1033263 RepID=A0AAD7GEJ2_MYCRO|nr:hypothetical protein B0H17DRAFT_1063311 [Mycena rosella]